ncbi:hypothetical protein AAFF_G00273970 [Aldrovandia affinis]|uniref:Uncharacterized protein n=1 Tax=Aldrovandia affinis TaxID=143900 RepID=A0AAD7SRN4_9TELE|nr:hypothetical protein AAFF_G00273970 [Aldrovandia affinis]
MNCAWCLQPAGHCANAVTPVAIADLIVPSGQRSAAGGRPDWRMTKDDLIGLSGEFLLVFHIDGVADLLFSLSVQINTN